jgi:hypothetical protein
MLDLQPTGALPLRGAASGLLAAPELDGHKPVNQASAPTSNALAISSMMACASAAVQGALIGGPATSGVLAQPCALLYTAPTPFRQVSPVPAAYPCALITRHCCT